MRRNNCNRTNGDDERLSAGAPRGILRHLPNPIDLWQSRTPTSLLLLPFVFIIYILLQLPLDYNSATARNALRGRAKDISKLSTELSRVEKELDAVKGNQAEIKGMVGSLRRRLGRMKERRNARERLQRVRDQERAETETQRMQQQQRGVAGNGPLAIVSMAEATAIPTFAGRSNVEGSKKDD
ncbi:hypothetical protein ACHAXT_002810 [Thalassiosira profunda]